MTIKTIGNFTRLDDNDILYYEYLKGYLDSIDPLCSLLINKTDLKISFRLTPSYPKLLIPLLTAVKEIHTKFSIQVEFAKSIKSANSISFIIFL
jgi:hypothetical protein